MPADPWTMQVAAYPDQLLGLGGLRWHDCGPTRLSAYLDAKQSLNLALHLAPTETKRAAVELRLRPSDAGAPDVIIIDRFLPALDRADEAFVAPSSAPIAHPILARAELLALGSDRLREVADRLRDQLILPKLVGGA